MNKKKHDEAHANDNIKIWCHQRPERIRGGIHERKLSPHEQVCGKKKKVKLTLKLILKVPKNPKLFHKITMESLYEYPNYDFSFLTKIGINIYYNLVATRPTTHRAIITEEQFFSIKNHKAEINIKYIETKKTYITASALSVIAVHDATRF